MIAESGTGSLSSWDNSSEVIDFQGESLRKRGRLIVPDGIHGTRSILKERVRTGAYTVKGVLRVNPSPEFMDLWLPRILGGAEGGNDVFSVQDDLATNGTFALLIDRTFDIFQYTDLMVNRAMFRGRAMLEDEETPQPIELFLELFGKTETIDKTWPDPAPAIGVAATDYPYTFEDAVLNLQSSARNMMRWQLLIDNHLAVRFSNSLTATSITPRRRSVRMQVVTPATSDETALYDQALAGTTGSVVFTNGSYVLTFTFGGAVQVPPLSPVVPGKEEIVLELDNYIHKASTNVELTVTNDKTA